MSPFVCAPLNGEPGGVPAPVLPIADWKNQKPAVASPLVNPQAMELICSGSGAIKLLVKTDDGVQEMSSHTLDCPLCVHVGAPPPAAQAQLPVAHPLAHALRPIPAAHIAARTAAPLPPRGPPAFS